MTTQMVTEEDFSDEQEFGEPSSNDRSVAMMAHIGGFLTSFLMPAILILANKGKHPFLLKHCRESLNYQITLYLHACLLNFPAALFAIIAWQVFGAAFSISLLVFSATLLLLAGAMVLFELVLVILAAVACSKGKDFRYPLTIRFFR